MTDSGLNLQTAADRKESSTEGAGAVPRRIRRALVVSLLFIHALLLGWSASRNSWTWDEVAFLPAGISHWHFGDYELFDVNPPLVRMVAAVPVLFADPELDWDGYTTNPTVRPERPIGERFLANNGERSFRLLTLARWACIPFSLLGGFVCYHWSRQLFGDSSGILALFLWTFSPNIIAHGQLITADIGGTSFGILGFYVFHRWLSHPSWRQTLLLGGVLGLMQLTKSTWVIMFAVWPAIWLCWRRFSSEERQKQWFRKEGCRLAIALAMAVYILNFGYCFQGTGKPLGDYEFISTAIGGPVKPGEEDRGQIPSYPTSYRGIIGNQFTDTFLAGFPVPLPQKYVEGIDRQKSHFEHNNRSYIAGEWKDGGRWYYYLYALSLKTPHGFWLIACSAMIGAILLPRLRLRQSAEAFLLGSMMLLLAFVSMQTGINRHLRYTLPAFPFAFILISRAALLVKGTNRKLALPVVVGCLWAVFSCLSEHPHHLSYFNELAGGPKNGGRHLASSNVDWGQDLLFLREWLDENPEVELDGLGWHCRVVDPAIVGITNSPVPRIATPGWYAVSQNIFRANPSFRYFRDLSPVSWAGRSIGIFRITEADADRLREESEIPSVSSDSLVSLVKSKRLPPDRVPVCANLSPNGQILIGTASGRVTQHMPGSLTSIQDLIIGEKRVCDLRSSVDGQLFVIGWGHGRIAVYSDIAAPPAEVTSNRRLRCLDISPDNQFLATGNEDGTVEIRLISDPRNVIAALPHDLSVLTVRFASGGKLLAAGTGSVDSKTNGQVRIWDTTDWKQIRSLPDSNAVVKTMCTSQNGSLLAARGDGGSVRVWDLHSETAPVSLDNSAAVMTLQFTPADRFVIGGDYTGRLRIWDARSGRLLVLKSAHKGKVSGFTLLNDSGQIITTGADRFIRLWDVSGVVGKIDRLSSQRANRTAFVSHEKGPAK